MKILLISDIPPYVIGGAEQQSALLAHAWADLGHTIEIFGHRIPNNTELTTKTNEKILLRRIRVIYSLGRLFRAISYFISLSIQVIAHRKQFDIIYCRFLGEAALSIILLKFLKIINLPLVCVPASAGNSENADLALINSLPFASKLKKIININCTCLNYISPKIEDSMTQAGIHPKHVSRIPNGVKVPISRTIEPTNRPNKLLFVGRLSKQKGLDIFLNALSQLNNQKINFSCRIVGDGIELEALKKSVIKLELSEKITFVGNLTNEDAKAEMMHADYFILPSRYEGMSNAALEALACGLPCILTKCGGIDVYLPKDTAYLCEPDELLSLILALKNALTADIVTWKKMSAASKKIIADKFSIEIIAQRNIDLFKYITCA